MADQNITVQTPDCKERVALDLMESILSRARDDRPIEISEEKNHEQAMIELFLKCRAAVHGKNPFRPGSKRSTTARIVAS